MKYPVRTSATPKKQPQTETLYVTRFLEVVRDVRNMRKELAEMRETFDTKHTKAMEKMLKTMENRIARSLLTVDARIDKLMKEVKNETHETDS